MLPLLLGGSARTERLRVLALGAHPDDVEIGAGGLLLRLAAERPSDLTVCLLCGAGTPREAEARAAAAAFSPGADVDVRVHGLPDGRVPAHWGEAKALLEELGAALPRPDLVLAPRASDAHQDHRALARLVPTVWRDSLVLSYEVPKWDGDLGRPAVYVPLDAAVQRRKWELLDTSYPSQRGRDWWGEELFAGLGRVRGVECRAPYAEAFEIGKAVLGLTTASSGPPREDREDATTSATVRGVRGATGSCT